MSDFVAESELTVLHKRISVLEKELKQAKVDWLDETARQAMVGLIAMPVEDLVALADLEYPEGTTVGQAMARQAYSIADDMLAEKERRHAG